MEQSKKYKVGIRVTEEQWKKFKIALVQNGTNATKVISSFVIKYKVTNVKSEKEIGNGDSGH